MSTLPKELIVDILTRLPAKSLCRFKCLSKRYKFLISHPLFVKKHVSLGRTRLLLDGMMDLFTVDLETVSHGDDNVSALALKFPGRKPNDLPWVSCIGSSNGLLCLRMQGSQLVVYNPSIADFKKIVDPDQSISYDESGVLYGFGYAESIDDYKFVKIVSPEKIAKVYSLRKDSWTRIPNHLLFYQECFHVGISLHGSIHWALYNLEGWYMIAAFDLVQEKFNILPPPDMVLKHNCRFSLKVLMGKLCLVTDNSDSDGDGDVDNENQFWIMLEYGVKESWTRILVPTRFSLLSPLCVLRNGTTMLIMMNQRLVFWDLNNGMLKDVEVHTITDEYPHAVVTFGEKYRWLDGLLYVESLVSSDYDPDFSREDPFFRDWFE